MTVAVVILAGGAGRRLGGVNKAGLLLPDGRTHLAAILATAAEAGCGPVVVVAAAPHGDAVRALAGATPVVWNARPERGMLSSLVCGLEALGPAALGALAWPVDHARVGASAVRAVLAAADAERAVVPTFAGRGGHPTFFGRALWAELAAAVDGEGGARAVLGRVPARVTRVPVGDEGVVLDVDTPA
jgi:CTP:molybdopterin cytidylyltransferase MocA